MTILMVALVLIPAGAMAGEYEISREGPPLTVPPSSGNSTNNPPKLDVSGNGRRDFADVTTYFNQLAELAKSGEPANFDYNGTGRFDFADVVWLFKNLQ